MQIHGKLFCTSIHFSDLTSIMVSHLNGNTCQSQWYCVEILEILVLFYRKLSRKCSYYRFLRFTLECCRLILILAFMDGIVLT